MDISDRVTILRKGKSVETVNTAESSEKQLTELMVGKAVELSIERPEPVNVKPILNVVDLTVKNSEGSIALDDVSFVINRVWQALQEAVRKSFARLSQDFRR